MEKLAGPVPKRTLKRDGVRTVMGMTARGSLPEITIYAVYRVLPINLFSQQCTYAAVGAVLWDDAGPGGSVVSPVGTRGTFRYSALPTKKLLTAKWFAQAAAQSVHTIFIGQLAIHTFDSKAKCEEWLTQK